MGRSKRRYPKGVAIREYEQAELDVWIEPTHENSDHSRELFEQMEGLEYIKKQKEELEKQKKEFASTMERVRYAEDHFDKREEDLSKRFAKLTYLDNALALRQVHLDKQENIIAKDNEKNKIYLENLNLREKQLNDRETELAAIETKIAAREKQLKKNEVDYKNRLDRLRYSEAGFADLCRDLDALAEELEKKLASAEGREADIADIEADSEKVRKALLNAIKYLDDHKADD